MYPGCNPIIPAATLCIQAFAEKLSEGSGVALPPDAQVNMVVCSEFIDSQLALQGGGGGAAAAGAMGGSAAGPNRVRIASVCCVLCAVCCVLCGMWGHGATGSPWPWPWPWPMLRWVRWSPWLVLEGEL